MYVCTPLSFISRVGRAPFGWYCCCWRGVLDRPLYGHVSRPFNMYFFFFFFFVSIVRIVIPVPLFLSKVVFQLGYYILLYIFFSSSPSPFFLNDWVPRSCLSRLRIVSRAVRADHVKSASRRGLWNEVSSSLSKNAALKSYADREQNKKKEIVIRKSQHSSIRNDYEGFVPE